MRKKSTAVVLAAAMAASVFSMCGTGFATENSGDEVENFNATGYPIVNEPITLKVMFGIRDVDSMIDPSEMPAVQRLEEETGIKLEWEVVKGSDWSTKLNLMFASGEYPDIILSPNPTVDTEEYGVTQQLLIPLNDDLTSKYMPNYTERRAAEDEDPCVGLKKSDGNIYSIGYLVGQNIDTNAHFFMNQDWMDRLGLETPDNVDELLNVLRKFKSEDADGDGDPNNEIPLEMGVDAAFYGVRYLLPLFGIPCSPDKGIYMDDDKNVQFTPTQEGFRKCMEWLHTCYEEGLVDPEIISQDINTVEAKLKEGNAGFFTAWRLKAMGFDDGVMKTCTLYTPVSSDDYPVSMYRYIERAKEGAYITIANQYVPQSLRLLDAMLDTDMMYSLYYGEEDADDGTGWKNDDNGKITVLNNGSVDVKNFLDCNTLFFGPGKYLDSVFNWPEQRIEKMDYCKAYDEAGIIQKYSDDYLDLAPLTSQQISDLSLKETDINNAVSENMATFITEGVTDDSWNNFVSLFDGMDVASYVKTYQDAIDTMDLK